MTDFNLIDFKTAAKRPAERKVSFDDFIMMLVSKPPTLAASSTPLPKRIRQTTDYWKNANPKPDSKFQFKKTNIAEWVTF